MNDKRRLGFVGIVVDDRDVSGSEVNRVLAANAECIVARLGLPGENVPAAVITLVVRADADELGRLTGRLGQIAGVSVKSALSKVSPGRARKEHYESRY